MRKQSAIVGSGFMVSYACTAKCRHCMYGCSYQGRRDYVTPEKAEEIMAQLEWAGVTDLHIGGGEPFLNFEGLLEVIRAMNQHQILVDYIETNAFWCTDQDAAEEKLRKLADLGVETIMASCDPFHSEYVPLDRVTTFVRACRKVGIGYFVWKEQFYRRLSKLDPKEAHSAEELKEALGDDYIIETAREYGIGMNGRALQIAREIYPKRPAREVSEKTQCTRILRGMHCHVDLYGNVVPAGCTGFAVPIADFTERRDRLTDPSVYPVLARVLTGGTKALLEYAVSLGFDPETEAATNCDLCYQIRCYLREHGDYKEIGPDVFYEMMET